MMAPDYRRPELRAVEKPQRGARVLAKVNADAEADALEKREKAASKKFDGYRCRWPEAHVCRFALESAHIKHASLGGEMDRKNLVTLCAWLHRRGPETQQYGQLKIEPETPAGAQGPLAFYRQTLDGSYYLVRRELAPFVYERD